MKNANQIQTICKCSSCKRPGFFSQTPNGGDNITCPLCETFEYTTTTTDLEFPESDIRYDFYFCPQCLIMFDTGCTHAENGCTENDFNAHVIGKWKHKTTGIVYSGMPKFENVKEWLDCANDVEVLQIVCLNSGYHCDNAWHSKAEKPQYYKQCRYAIVQDDPSNPITSFTFIH